ncbi:magnesium/cobalt transporter CorA [Paenibacillus sp. NEAU-GSW1]|uniref:magnesium/cobalt transporter CorA n=1 Tax=Paenibacillus sp. NEAU-GSW1 TaxID=2682486 RepID=UPI0012E2C412|nr:magnesium/cobalt transporter CorA [Paenibacillus sp. NEAU-GSW1]MUT67040.1 magnesium/cobalt transporter CorA [Paenibacillus sp. NEAU-GSW1]
MIHITGLTKTGQWRNNITIEALGEAELEWYWADFSEPTEEESALLSSYFHFHPLAIEDCFHLLQRPKLDHYDPIHFLVLHSIDPATLAVYEVNMFIGKSFLVTFHYQPCTEIDEARVKMTRSTKSQQDWSLFAAYTVIDKLVDQYFPAVQELEELVLDKEVGGLNGISQTAMDDIFNIRSRLLRLRKTILPMRELLYRIINTEKINGLNHYLAFYHDIYDHLLKLAEMTDACREMTADLRDSYISYNSNRMNAIMKTLTVITTIFMPLTFLAGLYGMNFVNMPELKWHWGYFSLLGVMVLIGLGMYAWFRRKGWFD